ncbi:MAG: methyltransferase domain-containing protein [Syntrophomonas sp.]
MNNDSWLKNFFTSGFYEKYFGWELDKENPVQIAESVLKLLDAESGHILDWCGGWGRISIHFANQGFKVSILDFNPEYLHRARENFKQNGLSIDTIFADCRETPSNIQADYAVCLFNSLGFMNDEEQIKALVSLNQALKPGAKVVMDVMNLLFLAPYIKRPFEAKRPDGCISRQTNSFDFITNTMHSFFEIIDDWGNVRDRKEFYQRLYTPSDLKGLFEAAGFKVDNIFGGFNKEKITFDTPKLVIVAQK